MRGHLRWCLDLPVRRIWVILGPGTTPVYEKITSIVPDLKKYTTVAGCRIMEYITYGNDIHLNIF